MFLPLFAAVWIYFLILSASAQGLEKKTEKTSFTQFVVLVSTIVARYVLPAGERAPRQSARPSQQAKAYELLKAKTTVLLNADLKNQTMYLTCPQQSL